MSNPEQLARLRKELLVAMPDATVLASWQQLERLPYLAAVISECFRKAMGTTSRFVRVAHDNDIRYKNRVVPRGTTVSMSVMPIHRNEEVFPEPDRFLPERWLGKDITRADLLVLGKGSRMCAGIK